VAIAGARDPGSDSASDARTGFPDSATARIAITNGWHRVIAIRLSGPLGLSDNVRLDARVPFTLTQLGLFDDINDAVTATRPPAQDRRLHQP